MDPRDRRTDLPVLLLHNLDRSWPADEVEETLHEVSTLESAVRKQGHPVLNVPVQDTNLKSILSVYNPDEYIVLNWCEDLPGLAHSDALVAQTLESLGFSYTGSPPWVLALSWDKPRVKNLLQQNGISTPQWRVYANSRTEDWKVFPAIVKPAGEHCSIGVDKGAVVLGKQELRARVTYVLDKFHQPALVEDFIDGRELHVSVLGDGNIIMLPPAEMDFAAFADLRDRVCTFESKFSPESDHYKEIRLKLPARLEPSQYDSLEKTVYSAYNVLGCRDYARIDLRMRDGVFYVLDINPNADISYQTSIVYAAEAAGYSYGAMISYLINLAGRRHPRFGSWYTPDRMSGGSY